MKNSINIAIPDFIAQAFPILKEATYVREFASFITLYPDADYYLLQIASNQSLILVAIDYPDPIDESIQVKSLSGGFEFEFAHLIKPYANDQYIEVHTNDDMDDSFFIPDPKSYYRYYLAVVKQKIDW